LLGQNQTHKRNDHKGISKHIEIVRFHFSRKDTRCGSPIRARNSAHFLRCYTHFVARSPFLFDRPSRRSPRPASALPQDAEPPNNDAPTQSLLPLDIVSDAPSETPTSSAPRTWTVRELVAALTRHVEQGFLDVRVEGEISNCRPAPSGHLYFTLKDGDAQLSCVMFRSRAQLLRFNLQDGLQVLARGRVSVYESRGQMQLVVNSVAPLGDGALRLAFEQLKQKLSAEGLFDEARKRPLPPFAVNVGLITSPTGAVIQDFLNIVHRRHRGLNVLLYPATVQGSTAAAEFCSGLRWFQSNPGVVDLIVLARGGGSLEDLAAFNNESLARAIADSDVPVVSAIGHETDFTIADFVADLRAPTPSAAAEIITQHHYRIDERIAQLMDRNVRAFRYHIVIARERFNAAITSRSFSGMRDFSARRLQHLDELSARLCDAHRRDLKRHRERLQSLALQLSPPHMAHRLLVARTRLDKLDNLNRQAASRRIATQRHRLAPLRAQLNALSPHAVLERGYALVFNAQGALVRDAATLSLGDLLDTRLASGSVRSTVLQKAVPSTTLPPGKT
jgi:exodeoxyribonuclease VII large subunit